MSAKKSSRCSSSSSNNSSSDSDSESSENTKAKLQDAVETTIKNKKSSPNESNSEANESSSSNSNSSSSSSSDNSETEQENPQKCPNKRIAKIDGENSIAEEKEVNKSDESKPKKRRVNETIESPNAENNDKCEKIAVPTREENSNENKHQSSGKSPYNPEEIDSPKERSLSPDKIMEKVLPQPDNISSTKEIQNDIHSANISKEKLKSNDDKSKKSNEKHDSEIERSKRRTRSPRNSDGHRSRSPRRKNDNAEKRDREIRSDRSRRKSSKSPARKRSDRKTESSRYRSRSPIPDDARRKPYDSSRKRREQRNRSKSPTKDQKTSKEDGEIVEDSHPDSEITPRQRKTVDILTSRTGGAYIPPAKLRMLQNEITDKSSAAYQRIAWEALKKSIHGYINKVNVDNIGIITRELLHENIVRGRGLLCRSIIQAQAASPTFTHVYAALVAIINSKFPNIGELLLKRLVIQFKRGFRRNDKMVCLSASRFIAHLVNQRVAHEILALEILTLLVETPTNDSVEVAIAFLKECGMKLTEVSAKGINAIFEMLKNILHEGKLDKRVQYMIEVVFQVRKDGFKDHLSVVEALELVEEEDQYTHLIMLDEATEPQDQLNVFKFDDKYQENEEKYKGLSKELLGSDADDSGSGSGSGSEGSDEDENDDDDENDDEKKATIIDSTETNLIALRRTIYLTIHSSLDYEECAHKLMKMQLKPGQEMELCHMFLDCCAEQRTYEKFYGLLAQRFCNINKIYIQPFEEIFKDTYSTTHRLDTNRLRNVSKFFAHLLFTDAISWEVMECVRLNEDDTTSSSRIFIKILFQELAEYMGLSKLNERLKDITLSESFSGLFPRDNPRNTRFAINFFTSIGLGGLTDELREFLKSAPKSVPAINHEIFDITDTSSSASSSTSSSSSSTSSSSSESESDDRKKKNKKKKINKKNNKNAEKEKKKKLKNGKKKKRQVSSSSSDSSSESSSSSSSSSSTSEDDKKSKNKRKKQSSKGKINRKDKSKSQMKKITHNPFRGGGNGTEDRGEIIEKIPTNRREEKRNDSREYEWGRNDNRNNDRNFDRERNERQTNPFRPDKSSDNERAYRNDIENRVDRSREHMRTKETSRRNRNKRDDRRGISKERG